MVEDFSAKGLPCVIGVLGIKDTSLEDAGGTRMREQGGFYALYSIETHLSESHASPSLEPNHFEHVNRVAGWIYESGAIEYKWILARYGMRTFDCNFL